MNILPRDPNLQLQLEREILSTLLVDQSLVAEAAEVLQPEDFIDPYHRLIYRTLLGLEERGHPVELPQLKREACRWMEEEFRRRRFRNVAGELEVRCRELEERLMKIEFSPPAVPLDRYLQLLKDHSLRRRLVEFAMRIPQLVENGELELAQVADQVEQLLYQILADTTRDGFKTAKEVLQQTREWLKERERTRGQLVTGLDTGFTDLNRMTSGFGPGDLIIIAARPSMGKTAFALNLATNVLKQQKGVAIFSLEMPSDQLMLRILSSEGMVPLQELRRGSLTPEEWGRLDRIYRWLENAPLHISDTGGVTLQMIKSQVRKLKLRDPSLSLVIIDYLQLIQGRGRERHLEVAEISRGLKLLARELQIPIIALSQLNRALESRPNKRPILSDLRESGAIEQDADLIMFIYRDSVYKELEERKKMAEAQEKGQQYQPKFINRDPDEAELIIGKQRNGPIGTINLLFYRKFTKFVDKGEEVVGGETQLEVPPAPVVEVERRYPKGAPAPQPAPQPAQQPAQQPTGQPQPAQQPAPQQPTQPQPAPQPAPRQPIQHSSTPLQQTPSAQQPTNPQLSPTSQPGEPSPEPPSPSTKFDIPGV